MGAMNRIFNLIYIWPTLNLINFVTDLEILLNGIHSHVVVLKAVYSASIVDTDISSFKLLIQTKRNSYVYLIDLVQRLTNL